MSNDRSILSLVAAAAVLISAGAAYAQSGSIVVDARSNIFGYGVSTPQPGGGGGGVVAPTINLLPGTDRTMRFTAYGDAGWDGQMRTDGPDGGTFAQSTVIPAVGPISGVDMLYSGHLVGLFLEPGDPAGLSPPSAFRFDHEFYFREPLYSPGARRVFFIGDGLREIGGGMQQAFRVPLGADRLVLGVADAFGFNGLAGYYDDNVGAFNVAYSVGPAACPADIGVAGGMSGRDGILNNNDFVVFVDYFFDHHPLADRGTTGGLPGSDGAFDNNDFIVFVDQFFSGCG